MTRNHKLINLMKALSPESGVRMRKRIKQSMGKDHAELRAFRIFNTDQAFIKGMES